MTSGYAGGYLIDAPICQSSVVYTEFELGHYTMFKEASPM